MKYLLSYYLLVSVLTLTSMQRPEAPQGKRPRKLIEEFEREEPSSPLKVVPSPSKEGYKTVTDVETPKRVRETKAQMGISSVNIRNFSGAPAFIAYSGPSGKMHRMLKNFNLAENKADATMNSEMNVVREGLYITAIPELFRIQASSDKKKLEITRMTSNKYATDFMSFGDIDYRPGGIITITINKGSDLLYPIDLNLKYE